MKVLVFGWEFPPHISGGLGTACYGLTKALAQFKDVEITFVVPKVWGDEDLPGITLLGAGEVPVIHKQVQFPDTDSKIEYYELHAGLIPYLGTSEFYELKSKATSGEKRLAEVDPEGKFIFGGDYGQTLFQEIRYYSLVAETLARELKFDVIHVHDWMTFPAGIAAQRISGKPLVVHMHSTEFDRSGLHVNPAICAIEKDGLMAAKQVIAVSHLTRNILIGNYSIAPEKIRTIYNAVEPVGYRERLKPKKSGNEKIVTFLGRITMQKGPEYFIEAASLVLQKMGNVRFVMAGKGDLRNAMINRVAELNLSAWFSFPGFIRDHEVTELFRQTNVFIMPSVSEPFGIVALEAMQAAVPVIVSKQSGASEILRNVIKIDYWNVNAIAEATLSLLSDKERSDKLRKQGKQEVAKLKWQNVAKQIRNIYVELTVGNPGAEEV